MAISPRGAKQKGSRFEKKIVDTINKLTGWSARKQPGSGIYQDFKNDVYIVSPLGQKFIIECKKWKHGWRTGDKAKQSADLLVIEKDFGSPKCYMEYDMMISFMKDIKYLHEENKKLKEQLNDKETDTKR